MTSASRPTDRFPISPGGAGCGCGIGVLLAVLALVALVVATATAAAELPAVKPDPTRPDITITVQEAFFRQMMAAYAPGDMLRQVTINMQPGGVIAVQGRIEASLLGQKLSTPFSLALRLSAPQGQLRVDVTDIQISASPTISAAARTMLGGLGDQISQAINNQVVAGLGSDAYIMDVTTGNHALVIRARWTGQ